MLTLFLFLEIEDGQMDWGYCKDSQGVTAAYCQIRFLFCILYIHLIFLLANLFLQVAQIAAICNSKPNTSFFLKKV